MKFKLPVCDHDYSDGKKNGVINGGTVWLDNIAQALRWHGHEAELISLTGEWGDCDYIIVQSEWTGMPNYNWTDARKIVLLGHFIKHVYPDPHAINAHILVTMWEGELLEGFKTFFMPHAYSDLMDDQNSGDRRGDIVWAGNQYQLRDEGWLSGLGVTQIKGTEPKDLFAIYRGANVCPNIHGDFQKNIVSTLPSRIADKPGMMINERFWNVLGCGGTLVTDYIPQMDKFFEEGELLIGKTKEEFQALIKEYNHDRSKGIERLAKAREKVRKHHTYRHRVRDLLKELKLSYKECD
jgi:hypothetical protein